MATRALIGYIEDGMLTATYNHYDGYPDHLGKALNDFFNSPTLAKDVANYGYISYIDGETGEIEAKNQQSPTKHSLGPSEEDNLFDVAALIDSFGADYAYFYTPESDEWQVVKNNGIRSMADALKNILPSSPEMNENSEQITTDESIAKVLSQALYSLKNQPSLTLDTWKKSLANDIRLNGVEQYADFTVEDFVEDYYNYATDTDLDESFIHQMKYKAGIIK